MMVLALCAILNAASVQAAETRARQIVLAMAPSEQLRLLYGFLALPFQGRGVPAGAIGSAGYVRGISRLGIPALQETDAILGIANPSNVRPGDVATAMPSGLSLASTWDTEMAYRAGALVGDEAWRKGFNVLLGPGINLARDPRNGRNFEYLGEDPVLAGTMAGSAVCGVQDQHVVATVKHFAMNDQETARHNLSAEVSESAMRESDLLAFEFALEQGRAGAVMCAYNRVNGIYSCENSHLLSEVLKGDWGFPGWVMSDWGAVHHTSAAMNGLDQESAAQLDGLLFDEPLAAAIASGAIPASTVRNMNQRILRSMFTVDVVDHAATPSPIDYAAHAQTALEEAERGIVLLKNDGLLPIDVSTKRIAVIGGHANVGVISGGGSSQVVPVGGPALLEPLSRNESPLRSYALYDPSAPLAAILALAPHAQVSFADGRDRNAAVALAQGADIAIVFATQWMTEGVDASDLALPDGQDALISAVAQANPRTVVVLETGNPVLMPWLPQVSAVMEAWYPGQKGGEAIANVLFGKSDAAGRLPITFPASEDQVAPLATSLVRYTDGSDVGYRRFVKQGLQPLFAFGHGLSYTSFAYTELRLTGGDTLRATLTVTNNGSRAGTDTPQLYLTRKAGKAEMRLLGWSQVTLAPGESGRLSVIVDPRLLADYDSQLRGWNLESGQYEAALGRASDDLKYRATASIFGRTLRP